MASREILVERFDTGRGFAVGYRADGRITHDLGGDVVDHVVLTMLSVIQDPTGIATAVAAAQAGRLTEPYEALGELGELVVERDGVRAELDLPDDSYEERMTLADFTPILAAWHAAWDGAKQQLT